VADLIDDNYGRLQDLILLLKIPMGTIKNFFQVYEQFAHATSNFPANSGPYIFRLMPKKCIYGFGFVCCGSRRTEHLASVTVVTYTPTTVRETGGYLASKERLGTTSRECATPCHVYWLVVFSGSVCQDFHCVLSALRKILCRFSHSVSHCVLMAHSLQRLQDSCHLCD
jgi:hypothetical protein